MNEAVASLILTSVALVVGIGGALAAVALNSPEMAMSIIGFAGGILSGKAAPGLSRAFRKKEPEPEEKE